MINRQNYLDLRVFLHHCERGLQLHPSTVERIRGHLRHTLEWADDTPFPQARRLDPVYPAYLVALDLSPASLTKGLGNARSFFRFARDAWRLRYREIDDQWISLLRPPRGHRLESRLEVRTYYTLDDVRRLLAVSAETLREQRTRAAIAMLFLSGMRDGALMTLPLSCVDIARREIRQLPEAGVQTKNGKAAVTYLLEIPDLMGVVASWDARLREQFAPDALWVPSVARSGETLLPYPTCYGNRASVLRDDLALLCQRAGMPYLSPHKLRHGHVVHALKQARDLADLKAISQNVMHSSVTITDGIYGNLIGNEVRETIAQLGQARSAELQVKVNELLELLRKG
jgi:integrase